ncbi:MAG: hypothetical protein H6815_08815 [Phycisphaeraceae bacterium]|nr:hypothetical protein [Phycisphaerales bacterium]MCB9860544.1 hypothetical protein [Phycisphaeraceae bacterium]
MIPLAAAGLIGGAVQIAKTIFGGESHAKPASSSFEQLLAKAKESFGSSGLGVTVEPSLGVHLSAEQMEKLAQLTDHADARGVTSLLVQHGDMSYVVDVARRQIVAKGDAATPPALRVDGFASLEVSAQQDDVVPMPSFGI